MILNALLFFALAGGQGAAAAPPPPDALGQAYYLFIQGRLLENQDDLPGAVNRYQQALTLLPNSAPLRAELANVFARIGRLDDAQDEAKRALGLDASNREAHRLLGLLEAAAIQNNSRMDNPDLTSAIGHLEQAIPTGTGDLPVQFTLAELYVRNRQYTKAIAALQRFLEDRPDYPQAYILLSQAYRENGQPEEAQKVWGNLLRDRPNLEPLRVSEAERLEQARQWREAAAVWGEIVAAPNGARYRTRQALALANAGDLSGSRTVLRAATEGAPKDITAWYLLAQVEQRAGDLAAAEAAARRIVAIDEVDARGPLALAQVLEARDDYRGIVELLGPRVTTPKEADIASGAFTQMATQLASAYTELKQARRAMETLERAHDHAPTDDVLAFNLAAVYEANKRFDQAERVFRDVIGRNPSHAPALNYLGYMLADRGQKLSEALAFIERALAEDADNPAYLDSLGWAYFKLKKFDDAREPLERAAAAMPDSSVVQDHLGDYYLQVKRYSDAAAAFDRALAGDRDGIDVSELTRKRDRARSLVSQ